MRLLSLVVLLFTLSAQENQMPLENVTLPFEPPPLNIILKLDDEINKTIEKIAEAIDHKDFNLSDIAEQYKKIGDLIPIATEGKKSQ